MTVMWRVICVVQVRKSLAENVKQLADNIRVVDERVERLEKARR